MKKGLSRGVLVLCAGALLAGCQPYVMEKCIKTYTYVPGPDNKIASEYSECVKQPQDPVPAFHLKNTDLLK
ncbi:MAG: hypothetical protein ABT940_01370 [Alphaproteobacteria bacterium]